MITWECVNYSWLSLFPWATQVIVLAKHKRVCNMLIHLIIFNTYSIWPWIEVEQTSKNRNSNIPNFRGLNFEHIQTSHLNPKPPSQTSLNTELFANFINNSSKSWKLNLEHVRTSDFGPKPNFKPPEYHQKPNTSRTSNCSFHL